MERGRVFKVLGDAVFEEKAGWRGVTKENTLYGSSTEEQQSQTIFPQKSFGRQVFQLASFVVVAVIARCGDTPATPPRCQPKSLAAAPQAL